MGLLDKLADKMLESMLRKQARDLHAKIIGMGYGNDRMVQGMAVVVHEFHVITGAPIDRIMAAVKVQLDKFPVRKS